MIPLPPVVVRRSDWPTVVLQALGTDVWRNFVANIVEKSSGDMPDTSALAMGDPSALAWTHGKSWLVTTALQVPGEGDVFLRFKTRDSVVAPQALIALNSSSGSMPADLLLQGASTGPFGPLQARIADRIKERKERTFSYNAKGGAPNGADPATSSHLVPGQFSAVLGAGADVASPFPFVSDYSAALLSHGARYFEYESKTLGTFGIRLVDETDEPGAWTDFAKNPPTAKVDVLTAVSASSAAASLVAQRYWFNRLVTMPFADTFMLRRVRQLATRLAETIIPGRDGVYTSADSAVASGDINAMAGAISLADGGLVDNTITSQLVGAGHRTIVSIMTATEGTAVLGPLVKLFAGYEYDTTATMFQYVPVFANPDSSIPMEATLAWATAMGGTFVDYPGVLQLGHITVGKISATTVKNEQFGIEAGEVVDLYIVSYSAAPNSVTLEFSDYAALTQEIVDVLVAHADDGGVLDILHVLGPCFLSKNKCKESKACTWSNEARTCSVRK